MCLCFPVGLARFVWWPPLSQARSSNSPSNNQKQDPETDRDCCVFHRRQGGEVAEDALRHRCFWTQGIVWGSDFSSRTPADAVSGSQRPMLAALRCATCCMHGFNTCMASRGGLGVLNGCIEWLEPLLCGSLQSIRCDQVHRAGAEPPSHQRKAGAAAAGLCDEARPTLVQEPR